MNDPALMRCPSWMAPSVAASGVVPAFSYWFIRNERFRVIANERVTRTGTTTVMQTGLALLVGDPAVASPVTSQDKRRGRDG